jgi:hypothetical protein
MSVSDDRDRDLFTGDTSDVSGQQPPRPPRRPTKPPENAGDAWEPEPEQDADNETTGDSIKFKPASKDNSTDAAGAKPPQARKSAADEIRGLRKVGGFKEQSKVKKEQLVIPACRPQPTWWTMVHPDPDFTREVFVIELKDKRQTFLILDDNLPEELMGEKALKLKRLAVAITRQGSLFIWEAAAPWEGDRGGVWTQTACEAIDAAREGWIRISAGEMAYEITRPNGVLPEPEWPDDSFESLLTKAYSGRVITDYDHPVLRELRGEV